MSRHLSGVLAVIGLVTAAVAASVPERQIPSPEVVGPGASSHGAALAPGAAARDTTILLGGSDRDDGSFETADGQPSWHGWTTVPPYEPPVPRWTVTDYNVPAGGGQLAMWCGRTYDNACAEGYGNGWNESLVFAYAVADPGQATTLQLTGVFSSDTEPGYDFLTLQAARGDTWQDILVLDGVHADQTLDEPITFAPGDYTGENGDEVWLRFHVESDGAWSDEDCLFDTQGAVQLGELTVAVAGGPVLVDDFEDGTADHWLPVYEVGSESFAALGRDLEPRFPDPCRVNDSWMVNWLAYDPEIMPHLEVALVSPPLAMPAGADQVRFAYDVIDNNGGAEALFSRALIRSTDSEDPDDLAGVAYDAHPFVVAYPPGPQRYAEDLGDLLVPAARWVQVAFQLVDYGWIFGAPAATGADLPYFDNAAVRAWPVAGPEITATDALLPQDTFPEQGDLDLADLASNWCRFDMAQSIAPAADLRIDPGDSIVAQIVSLTDGAVLQQTRLRYLVKANPLFDDVRQLPPGAVQEGDRIRGETAGHPCAVPNVDGRWFFDLPDTAFLFPGDVVHVRIEADEDLDGTLRTSVWPADATDFEDFTDASTYDPLGVMRCLPTLTSDQGAQPRILLWNDSADRDPGAWRFALQNLGLLLGQQIDVYRTRAARSHVGNGLGSRATVATLAGYDVLLYTSGDLSAGTLATSDFAISDGSDDVGLLESWFALGEPGDLKSALFAGDHLARSADGGDADLLAFWNQHVGARYESSDVADLVASQSSPGAAALAGNGVFADGRTWSLDGGCPDGFTFDAVEALGGTERLAAFVPGAFVYAAATRRTTSARDVVFLPCDLGRVVGGDAIDPGEWWVVPQRAEMLQEILFAFDYTGFAPPTATPVSPARLAVGAHPNPSNPRTTIALDLPRSGPVQVKLYDVRGRLVRTLQDGELAAGHHDVVWDGTDGTGRGVAAGVYFYRLEAGGEERLGKLAVVK